MPRRDGSGPVGQGPLTGRGLGNCTGVQNTAYGYGRGYSMGPGMGLKAGCGRGFGRFYTAAPAPVVFANDKDFLTAQKEILKNRLEIINSQLNNLAEDSK